MQRRTYPVVLALLVALSSGVWAYEEIDQVGLRAQPDGTTFEVHFYRDKTFVDDYVVVLGSDGWYYYAELDARGEYEASPYRVHIDDPAKIGIPKYLQRQRSAVRQAEIDAGVILRDGHGKVLTQPDGTEFLAYGENYGYDPRDGTYYVGTDFTAYGDHPPDGYVICIDGLPLINYGHGDPFWAFVYDDESGWYYYAEMNYVMLKKAIRKTGLTGLKARVAYVVSPYKVGIDNPPSYAPPTAVQERSWGAVKHFFHK